MSNISVRTARPSDAEVIAKLGGHVFTATFGYSVSSEDLQSFLSEFYTPSAISAYLDDRNKTTLVATNGSGEIKGFATLTRNTSEPCVEDLEGKAELGRLYIDTSAHRQGLGGLLVKSVEEMARKEGFKNMWLGVWEENHKAMGAYEKWGYKLVGDHDFKFGSVVQTDLIMAKAL